MATLWDEAISEANDIHTDSNKHIQALAAMMKTILAKLARLDEVLEDQVVSPT